MVEKKKKYSNMSLLQLIKYNKDVKERFMQGANTKILNSFKARDARENYNNEYNRLLDASLKAGTPDEVKKLIDKRNETLRKLISNSK
jgi:hypothetical protein